jgi:predicted NBD/HSP70 family sugar kinase
VVIEAARTLFLALSAVQAIVDPELIVLAGGIGLQPELALHLQRIAGGHPFAPRLVPSALGRRAAIAGAASCALAEALRPTGAP